MARIAWLGLLAAACTPPGDDDGYVLGLGTARVDGEERAVASPVAVSPGTWVETSADRFEVGAGEVAVIDGDAILAYTLGDEIAPDALAVDGPDAAVAELVEELGLERERGLLFDPDVWAVVAARPPDARLRFRPVSDEDLPGTASYGGAAPTAGRGVIAGAVAIGRAAQELVGGSAARNDPAARARALFALPTGRTEAVVSDGAASQWGAHLVGRYCQGSVALTLGATGVARWCDRGDCTEIAWAPDDEPSPGGGGRVFVGDRALAVDEERGGFVVDGLVDGILGGCR